MSVLIRFWKIKIKKFILLYNPVLVYLEIFQILSTLSSLSSISILFIQFCLNAAAQNWLWQYLDRRRSDWRVKWACFSYTRLTKRCSHRENVAIEGSDQYDKSLILEGKILLVTFENKLTLLFFMFHVEDASEHP